MCKILYSSHLSGRDKGEHPGPTHSSQHYVLWSWVKMRESGCSGDPSAPDPEGLPLEGAMIRPGGILGWWGPKGPESLYLSALVSASNYHGMEEMLKHPPRSP
jgi:hypothetical protein